MKRFLIFLSFAALLTACSPRQRSGGNVAPFPRDTDDAIPTEEIQPPAAPAPAPTPAPTPPPAKRDAAYGIPEPGKPGFMRSPHNPGAGLIDYRGLPPATEVKDPYTPGKIILVP